MSRLILIWSLMTATLLSARPALYAAEGDPDPKEIKELVDKAFAYLKQRQGGDGSFVPKIAGPGVSALVAASLLRHGYGPDDPLVAKTLAFLEKKVQKDGGVYDKQLANYTTSVALMA